MLRGMIQQGMLMMEHNGDPYTLGEVDKDDGSEFFIHHEGHADAEESQGKDEEERARATEGAGEGEHNENNN